MMITSVLVTMPAPAAAGSARLFVGGSDFVLQTDNTTGRVVLNASDLILGNISMQALETTLLAMSAQLQNLQAHPTVGDVTFTGGGIFTAMPYNTIYGMLNVTAFAYDTLPPMLYLTVIHGEMNIVSNAVLLNLQGLNSLTITDGFVNIQFNPALTSLTGLSSLATINGNGIIGHNALTNLTGLNGLQHVSGSLLIQPATYFPSYTPTELAICEDLTSLTGLSSLAAIDGGLNVENNPQLVNLVGLSALQTVSTSMTVQNNTAMSTLNGLQTLSYIGGAVLLANNALKNLTGLEGLTAINESLYVQPPPWCPGLTSAQFIVCDSVTTLSGLENVALIQGELSISSSTLVSLEGLNGVNLINGSVYITNNADLASLSGFGVKTINGALQITSNSQLNSLAGMNSLQAVSKLITISYQPSIASLAALSKLSILNGLYVQDTNISDFSSLGYTATSINGELYVISNTQMTSLAGLETVATIAGPLYATYNSALRSLEPLANLATVAGSVTLVDNQFTNLTGLGNLKNVTGSLTLVSSVLSSLAGMNALRSVGGQISIIAPITDLSVFNSVAQINGLSISSTNLESLVSLAPTAFTTINGPLTIGSTTVNGVSGNGNGLLQNLGGLEGIVTINGDLSIQNNAILTNLTALSNLQNVGLITISQAIDTLSPFNNLVQVNGLSLTSTNLVNFTSFEPRNLSVITGPLSVTSNNLLVNFAGLSALTNINDDNTPGNQLGLNIVNNAALLDLTGLNSLTSINGPLTITGSSALTSIAALGSVTTINGALSIYCNPNLVVCESLQAKLNASVTTNGYVVWDYCPGCCTGPSTTIDTSC